VRYYLERRDPEFKEKMAEVLCVYRQVKMLKQAAATSKKKPSDAIAILSYDELCRPRHSSSYAERRTMPVGSGTARYSRAAVIQHATGVFLPFGIICSSQRIEESEQAIIVGTEAGLFAALVGLELRQGCLLECKMCVQIGLRRVHRFMTEPQSDHRSAAVLPLAQSHLHRATPTSIA
jgi:hypothetical protein